METNVFNSENWPNASLLGGSLLWCRHVNFFASMLRSIKFEARLAGSFLRRYYLVDIFEWRERPNIARSNIDQMLPKPPQTRLIFQEVSAIFFGRYFGGDISYIPTFKYPLESNYWTSDAARRRRPVVIVVVVMIGATTPPPSPRR